MRPRPVALLAFSLFLVACSTDSQSPSRQSMPPRGAEHARRSGDRSHRPQRVVTYADRALAANGVYYIAVQRAGDSVRYAVDEVWRHDSGLGPVPQHGDSWEREASPTTPPPSGDHVIVIRFQHPYGNGFRQDIIDVNNGRLPDQTSTDSLRQVVQSDRRPQRVRAPEERSLSITQCIARASAVYLVNVDPTDAMPRYRVIEVWRHRGETPAPMPGAEVRPVMPQTRRGMEMALADEAILFLFDPPFERYGTAGVSSFVFPVLNGYAEGGIALGEIQREVTEAPKPDGVSRSQSRDS